MITEIKPSRAQKYRDEVARGIAGWGLLTLVLGWAFGAVLLYMSVNRPFDTTDPVAYAHVRLADIHAGYLFGAVLAIVSAHIAKAFFAWSAEVLRSLGRMEDTLNHSMITRIE